LDEPPPLPSAPPPLPNWSSFPKATPLTHYDEVDFIDDDGDASAAWRIGEPFEDVPSKVAATIDANAEALIRSDVVRKRTEYLGMKQDSDKHRELKNGI